MAAPLALIDCNNFYASCEQAFEPSLLGRPLVVLSNNDGCIVARSREARQLGVAMGVPYAQVADRLQRLGVVVRSSNYALYGDMSQRVMTLLEARVPQLEGYSIDEAFAHLPALPPADLSLWAAELRVVVRQHLGLPIAVGVAPSKVLAKLANRFAKHEPGRAGVFNLLTEPTPDPWLQRLAVEDVWGVGRRLARWCRLRGIATALQLRDAPPGLLRRGLGVVGLRLQEELHGRSCLPLCSQPPPRQETCVSRSFGCPVVDPASLRQAVATHVVRAAEKLRRQGQRAGCLTVFVRTSPFAPGFYAASASQVLPLATQDTAVLLQAALPLADRLFRPGRPLQKAGVLLQDLRPCERLQQHLFVAMTPEQQQRRERLMALVDGMNGRFGAGTLQWAVAAGPAPWRLRHDHLSRHFTTRATDWPVVQAR